VKNNHLHEINNRLAQQFNLAVAAEVEKKKAKIANQIHLATVAEVEKERAKIANQIHLTIAAEVEKEKAKITNQIYLTATAEVENEKVRLAQEYIHASFEIEKEKNVVMIGIRNDLERVVSEKTSLLNALKD
jgi:uncharacterized protein YlxP (DUF503 family)